MSLSRRGGQLLSRAGALLRAPCCCKGKCYRHCGCIDRMPDYYDVSIVAVFCAICLHLPAPPFFPANDWHDSAGCTVSGTVRALTGAHCGTGDVFFHLPATLARDFNVVRTARNPILDPCIYGGWMDTYIEQGYISAYWNCATRQIEATATPDNTLFVSGSNTAPNQVRCRPVSGAGGPGSKCNRSFTFDFTLGAGCGLVGVDLFQGISGSASAVPGYL